MDKSCEYIFTKGMYKGGACASRGKVPLLGQVYCATHAREIEKKANRIQQSTAIMNQIQEPGLMRMPGESIKSSIFFIMMNSNKQPDKLGDAGVAKFTKMISYMKREDVIRSYLIHADNGQPIDQSKIMSLRSHSDVEVGQNTLRLHGNISIEIYHKTRLKVDLTRLRNDTKQYLGYTTKITVTCPKVAQMPNIDNFVRYASKHQIEQGNVDTDDVEQE